MKELELSLMEYRGYRSEDAIRPLLAQFEQEYSCHVRVKMVPWETGRDELVRIALYGKGPDVSEIGTTWCSSFIAMAALRPFTSPEIKSFGGASAFFPSSWQSGKLIDDDRVWAVPWLASIRVLYYRRDLLEQAGVDEKTAFQSHAQMVQTLERLRAAGIPIPLTLQTRKPLIPPSLHSLASWVWGAGGDFISPDGTHTSFNRPKARAGIRAFLELSQYLSPEARNLDTAQSENLFWKGQAAVSLSWQPPFLALLEKVADPNVIANLGVAPIPGVPFVGGSNLVVWRHAAFTHEDLAVELVRFLTGRQAQKTFNPKVGFFPVCPSVFDAPPFSDDAFHQVLVQSLNTGRSFPAIKQWAIVEDRLMQALGPLWEAVLAHPGGDVDAIIAEHLDTLARRLDLVLQPV